MGSRPHPPTNLPRAQTKLRKNIKTFRENHQMNAGFHPKQDRNPSPTPPPSTIFLIQTPPVRPSQADRRETTACQTTTSQPAACGPNTNLTISLQARNPAGTSIGARASVTSKKPVLSAHACEPRSRQRKNVYLIQVDAHGTVHPAFRLAVLSEPEKAKLIIMLRRMQIGSASRLTAYCILPKPPLFDDVDKLIADIATGMDQPAQSFQ